MAPHEGKPASNPPSDPACDPASDPPSHLGDPACASNDPPSTSDPHPPTPLSSSPGSTSPGSGLSSQGDEENNEEGRRGKGGRKRLKLRLSKFQRIGWADIKASAREFFSNPAHVAVFVWMLLSLPWCLIIGLNMLGLLAPLVLNGDQEKSLQWDEEAHQVMNALFVLMAVILLPLLFRQTFLLLRWLPRDRVELRRAFCRGGTRKPHDRTHIATVLFWGHVACWATLAYALLFWLVPEANRPAWALWVTGTLSMIAPVFALLHLVLSPLNGDFDIVKDGDEDMVRMYERRYAFFLGEEEVQEAEWAGTVFPGCCNNTRVAACVFFFPLCVFGYNMERLGFGNRVVHAMAFFVVLFGPFLVFMLSARAAGAWSHQTSIIAAYIISGLVLTLLGLAYGGMWRSHMRRVFKLPGSKLCCGSARLTDACIWLWCCCCALCQEVRTVDVYSVEEARGEGGGDTGIEVEDEEGGETGGFQSKGGLAPLPPEGMFRT